jgi:lipopolysaccharide transport system ATP-binding protein
MSSIISVENLSKAYRIGPKRENADSLVCMLRDSLTAPFRNWQRMSQPAQDDNAKKDSDDVHWALRSVSMEIMEGDVLGVIGRNGAGKSTLLKILSRITEPSGGQVKIRGRISSLLEVGTGFHPELTGRENIFLNGTILGMTRRDIVAKYDEIVDFSGVEKFLDTPVKRYSSGMKVRLAFAVAAHLEPEILIVDEVLAVGDLEFQKKCIGKMHQVAKSGRTVVFVSHSMAAVRRLCTKAIYLDCGVCTEVLETEEAIALYEIQTPCLARVWKGSDRPGDEAAKISSIRAFTPGVLHSDTLLIENELCIEIEFELLQRGYNPKLNLHFFSQNGEYIFVSHEFDVTSNGPRDPGRHRSTCKVPPNFFNTGAVCVGVALTNYHPFQIHCFEKEALTILFEESSGAEVFRAGYAGTIPGPIRPALDWTLTSSDLNLESCS